LIDKDIIVSISKSDLLDDELKKEITAEFPEKLKPLFFFRSYTRRFGRTKR
jgi:GTP-binding protein